MHENYTAARLKLRLPYWKKFSADKSDKSDENIAQCRKLCLPENMSAENLSYKVYSVFVIKRKTDLRREWSVE